MNLGIWCVLVLAALFVIIMIAGLIDKIKSEGEIQSEFIYMYPKLRVKYLNNKMERLKYIEGKSDWIDLRCAEDIELKKGEFKLLPLGVAMEIPSGFEAYVIPRSSTFKNYGIIQTNSMGLIDESYCGNNDQWFMPVYATRDTLIRMNDRVCQFRLMAHQPIIEIEEVKSLDGEDRGGFGSTGKQ